MSCKKTYLYCGTSPELYEHIGNIIHFPMIDIHPIKLHADEIEYAIKAWKESDIIIFTSQFSVRYFCDFLHDHADSNDFVHKVVCVIGEETRQVYHRRSGLVPDVVACVETSDGLINELKPYKEKISGKKILFPRSALPNPLIKDTLTKDFNAVVTELSIYDNVKPEKRPLPDRKVDGIIFTSPSTVINFMKDYERIPEDWEVLVKGPVTQHRLQKFNYAGKLIDEN